MDETFVTYWLNFTPSFSPSGAGDRKLSLESVYHTVMSSHIVPAAISFSVGGLLMLFLWGQSSHNLLQDVEFEGGGKLKTWDEILSPVQYFCVQFDSVLEEVQIHMCLVALGTRIWVALHVPAVCSQVTRKNAQNILDAIQRVLDKLKKWAIEASRSLTRPSTSQGHPQYQYRQGNEGFANTSAEKVLGVLVDGRLDMTQQCAFTTQNDKHVLGCIKTSIILPLWPALFWAPHCKKYIEMLEHVQRGEMELVKSLEYNSYEEQLKKVEVFSLKKKRLRDELTTPKTTWKDLVARMEKENVLHDVLVRVDEVHVFMLKQLQLICAKENQHKKALKM
ncbi:hypothetical protein WISP_22633 [Willisornis vidua]|uniref:Uncharacterized protein n=1 Tax=Willisornis vidua TaxID=1566151 RepID=A0ABQ9DMS5_9PASS|nr:hypothetical protein WISP_22633 [Willisornis vidua]